MSRLDYRRADGTVDNGTWVGDSDNGLAHLIYGEIVPSDIAECGVELHNVTASKALGKARCSICREISSGEMEDVF